MKPLRVLTAVLLFSAMAAEEASAQTPLAPIPTPPGGVVVVPQVRTYGRVRYRRRRPRRRVNPMLRMQRMINRGYVAPF